MIDISYAGYNVTNPSSFIIDRPDGIDAHDLILFKSLTSVMINDEMITISPNTFFFFPKGAKQYYFSLEQNLINDFIHFDLSEDMLFLIKNIPVCKPFQIECTEYLEHLFYLINAEFFISSETRNNNLIQYLVILLRKINDTLHDNSLFDEQTLLLMHKVRHNILANPQSDWTVEKLASECLMSPSRFQNIYKQLFSSNCISDVLNARLMLAENLIIRTNNTIYEIAFLCGYNNIEHFSREFKKKFGLSPTKYRSSLCTSTKEFCQLHEDVASDNHKIY